MRLSDFMWMPYSEDRQDWRKDIAAAAIEEEWGPELRYLRDYVSDNFEIAHAQGLIRQADDRSYCLFRVGSLTTREGEPISVLGVKNRLAGKQPYFYKYTFQRSRFDVRLDDGVHHETAPPSPKYDMPPYRPEYKLVYNFSHYLEDHETRAAESFPSLNAHQRFLCIFAALELAHRRGMAAAVPQWFRDKKAEEGGYQWLLPLFINSESLSSKPDLIATLDPHDEWQEYNVRTLLPPSWAYGHARAVTTRDPTFRTWA